LHELAALPPDEAVVVAVELLDTRFTPAWLDAHPSDRQLVAYFADRRGAPKSDAQERGEALQLEARRGHDVCARLGAIACPTIVAAGRYDGIAPRANSEAIAARVPGAELHVYEGGHAFFVQDPNAFPEVLAFLAGNAS
jgi:pimeloyl-ACP methyl ester carboxylesterase